MFNKNKKHKKNSDQKKGLKAGLIIVLIIVLVLGVIVANYKYNQTKAYVELVSAINFPYAMSGASYEGNISDDATQNIYLTSGEKIAEVYVSKGDSVVKGDQLFQYDTQALQSAVDEATLGVEAAQNTLANEKTRLEKYNAIVPVTEAEKNPQPQEFQMSDAQKLPAAYEGDGTAENPYKYLCTEETLVTGAEINTWVMDDTHVVLEIRDGNVTSGELIASWTINGSDFIAVDDSSYWSVISKSEFYPEIDLPEEDTTVKYTQAEKDKKVQEQTIAVQRATDGVNSANAKLNAAQVKLANATVTASMDGTVQTIGDPNNPPTDGSAFLSITSQSGMAVSGYLTEFQLGEINVGDEISVNGYMSGSFSDATITTISPYPDENADTWTDGNKNVSFYPYTAVLTEADGFSVGEGVSISLNVDVDFDNTICIMGVYVRTDEDGNQYVLIDDGHGRLKKQEVTTLPTSDAEYVQVVSGLSNDDMIAFPWGTKGKVGIKTTTKASVFEQMGLF